KIVPGVAAGAVVLPDRAPGPFGQVRPPVFPVGAARRTVAQAAVLGGRRHGHGYSLRPERASQDMEGCSISGCGAVRAQRSNPLLSPARDRVRVVGTIILACRAPVYRPTSFRLRCLRPSPACSCLPGTISLGAPRLCLPGRGEGYNMFIIDVRS